MARPTFDRIAAEAAGGEKPPSASTESDASDGAETDTDESGRAGLPGVDRRRLPPYDGAYDHVMSRVGLDRDDVETLSVISAALGRFGGFI